MIEKTMKSDATFKILSLDGGGARGVYTAQLLALVERESGALLKEHFDLIAGTSAGSIIAGAAAADVPMADVAELFTTDSPLIFRRRSFSWLQVRSKYPTGPLAEVIRGCVGDVAMGDVTTPLMITSSDITTGGVHVFKSGYLKDLGEPYVRDSGVALADAILASCAAPTFFDPVTVGDFTLADGGLWANNPSAIAITEAVSKFRIPIDRISVLSIGTGRSATLYSSRRSWGLLTGWGRRKLVSYFLSLQSQSASNIAKLLLGERFMRMDPEIEAWDLDDVMHLENLKAMAMRDFALHGADIMNSVRRTE